MPWGMPLADWEPRQHAGQAVLGGRAPHFRTATPRITESVTEPNNPAIHTGSKQHENNDYEPILSGVAVGFPWTMGWRAAGLSDQQPSHPAGPGSVLCGGSVMFS